jgi:hypothetical protein
MSEQSKQPSIKAYGLTRHGQPSDVLHVVEVPKPQPGPRDLLVRVVAVATNPVRSLLPLFFLSSSNLEFRAW